MKASSGQAGSRDEFVNIGAFELLWAQVKTYWVIVWEHFSSRDTTHANDFKERRRCRCFLFFFEGIHWRVTTGLRNSLAEACIDS